jgi:glutamate 5-kinase
VRTVIADGTDPDVLVAAHEGRPVGTVFHPRAVTGATPPLSTLWRAFRAPALGTLRCVPAGTALVERGETLCRHHIDAVSGEFGPGDVVDIRDAAGRTLARGPVRRAIEPGCPPDEPIVAGGDYVRIVEELP